MSAVQATAYVHRLIERTKRVRAAMEQIERNLSTVVDRREQSDANVIFLGCPTIWLNGLS